MKIASPLTLNLTDTRAFKAWLYGIWQSIFFVSPHVHISTITTKHLKQGSGTLKSICINIKSTGAVWLMFTMLYQSQATYNCDSKH